MRLDIRYTTRFSYTDPVRESHNEVRACPASDDRQQLVGYRLTTSPAARVLSYTDYWGTRVDAFGVREPHARLEITAEAMVETSAAPPPYRAPRWRELEDPAFREEHAEYTEPSSHSRWGEAVAKAARGRADALGDDVVSVVLGLHRLVGSSLSYTSGATYVGVPVEEVLACGAGVCQDYAHLLIAMCRSVGVPARYVSGYLFARDDATGEDAAEDAISVQTHAWVEAAVPGVGWWPLDPTNQQAVSERHVKIGHGRDYGDVAPLRGVFSGPPEHHLEVEVQLRRMAAGQQQQ